MQKRTEEALKAIEKGLLNGDMGGSGFLPSERELCRRLSIGRGALRAVFDELIRRKRVYHVPGKGMKLLFPERERLVLRKYILVMPATGTGVRNGEIANILCGAASSAAHFNAELLLFFSEDDLVGRRLAAHISEGGCDGIVFLDRFPKAVQEVVEQSGMRYVVANYEEAGSVPCVKMDFRGVGRIAGRYLVEHGFQNIGFIGGGAHPFIYKEMFAGLKGALAEDDLAPEKDICRIFEDALPEEQLSLAVEKLLKNIARKKGKCAIFAGRDHWARRIWTAAQRLEMNIPEDIALIGYDNVSWEEGRYVGLTTIEQPAFNIGETAIRLLNDAAEGMQPVQSALISGNIIERRSV